MESILCLRKTKSQSTCIFSFREWRGGIEFNKIKNAFDTIRCSCKYYIRRLLTPPSAAQAEQLHFLVLVELQPHEAPAPESLCGLA